MSLQSLPPSGGYLQATRQSSRDLRTDAGISITPESIERLLLSQAFTTSFKRVAKLHGLALPLKFSSHLDELNFISILSILNFGSGYRAPLHAQTGRGAWDSIRALMFALYLHSTEEGDLLSAKGLRALHISKIAELMGINLHVERPHKTIPGLTVGELGGPLHELASLITKVLNETGDILINSGYPNLGSFVVEALQQGGKASSGSTNGDAVEIVLERLVKGFPAFRDISTVNGQPIYCFKKALFLIHAINVRFGSISPPPFPIPSTTHLPVFSDNVLPSLLIHIGVIDLSSSSSLSGLFPRTNSDEQLKALLGPGPALPSIKSSDLPKIPIKEGPILSNNQSYILRAAAIDACELIAQAAQTLDVRSVGDGSLEWINELTLPDLDMWIWAVAKDRQDYRDLVRFVNTDTIFF
ncbi:hypothetical protein B0H34DRAFT_746495 [Crassisporium funariophilum]|nr:hypothetical protein B0H34DRAFT_746495 [Crassisporium funariophilum]